MKKICRMCGKEFETKSSRRSYCYEHDLLPCFECSKLFKPSSYQRDQYIYYNNKHIYCCKQCKDIGSVNTYKQTMINKYGKDSVFKIDQFLEKRKNTNLKKYNVDSAMKTEKTKNKFKDTMISYYGVPYAMQSTELKEKYKNNYLIKSKGKYTNPWQDKEIKQKAKNTCSEKYGDENYNNRNKYKKTNLKKYDVEYFNQMHLSKETLQITSSKENLKQYILSLNKQERNIDIIASKLNFSRTQLAILFYHKYHLDDEITLVKNNIKETELLNFLQTIYKGVIIQHTRKIILPYELDFYIPDRKVAIEFNGNLFHNSSYNPYNSNEEKSKNYHYNKSKLCEEKGIRLIHIYEYEWDNKRQRPILENIIKNALDINENKIYARNLDIEIRESKNMKDFFNKNNIQGFRGGQFAICLVDKQTRECYMSYIVGKAFFGKGKYDYEIIRGATKLEYTIVGGASKIWNYFIKNYNPKSIVYYIDYNYFNGNSLKNLPKMKFIKTQPSFKNYWVKEKKIKNRDPKHHKEITKLYKENKVLQIYNAGTKVYVWEKDDK